MTALIKFEAIRHALAEARDIDEIKEVRNKAEALRLYTKQQGMGLEMQNDIAEIKLRAERRAGELLREIERQQAGRPEKRLHDETISEPPTLSDLGISKSQSSRWQLEAEVPEEVFERHVAEVKAAKEELTSVGLRLLAKRIRKDQRCEEIAKQRDAIILPENLVLNQGDFRTSLDLESESVDLVFTDPPYGEQYLGLWFDLAKFAKRVLKPGGFLLAYSGQRFLPNVIDNLEKHLDYYWMISVLHTHGQLRMWHRRVWNSFKPLLVFSKGSARSRWFIDVIAKGDRDTKDYHEWAQPLEQARALMPSFSPLGGLIVDPMAGSGTIPIAAVLEGRIGIGCEIDGEKYDISKGRAHEIFKQNQKQR